MSVRCSVSIRARRLLAGRRNPSNSSPSPWKFQSAPGDCSPGDSLGKEDEHVSVDVSIRARRLLAGRPGTCFDTRYIEKFQSAPGDCSPGDVDGLKVALSMT